MLFLFYLKDVLHSIAQRLASTSLTLQKLVEDQLVLINKNIIKIG